MLRVCRMYKYRRRNGERDSVAPTMDYQKPQLSFGLIIQVILTYSGSLYTLAPSLINFPTATTLTRHQRPVIYVSLVIIIAGKSKPRMTRWPDASYSTIAGSEHRCRCHPVKIVKSRAGAGKFHCFEINIAVLIHCSFNSFKRSDQAIFSVRGV